MVPVVYDSVGKASFEGALDCLRPLEMRVSFGKASGAVPPFAPVLLSQRGSLFFTRPSVMHYVAARADLVAGAVAGAAELFRLIAAGKIRARVGGRWRLAQAGEAQRALAERRTSDAAPAVPGTRRRGSGLVSLLARGDRSSTIALPPEEAPCPPRPTLPVRRPPRCSARPSARTCAGPSIASPTARRWSRSTRAIAPPTGSSGTRPRWWPAPSSPAA